MGWRSDFSKDLERYRSRGGGSAWKLVLCEQGLWALLQYRLHRAVYRAQLPGLLKQPLHILFTITGKAIEIVTGISLPCTTQIGPGLYLPHYGVRILNSGVIVGADCCITQGVTVGVSGHGEHRGQPVIGDRVYIGANAVVAGKIHVGNDALIGANSLVNRDVPDHCTVVGVPATVISQRGSADYLSPNSLSDVPPLPPEPVHKPNP